MRNTNGICILVTHLGVICVLALLSGCDDDAQEALCNSVFRDSSSNWTSAQLAKVRYDMGFDYCKWLPIVDAQRRECAAAAKTRGHRMACIKYDSAELRNAAASAIDEANSQWPGTRYSDALGAAHECWANVNLDKFILEQVPRRLHVEFRIGENFKNRYTTILTRENSGWSCSAGNDAFQNPEACEYVDRECRGKALATKHKLILTEKFASSVSGNLESPGYGKWISEELRAFAGLIIVPPDTPEVQGRVEVDCSESVGAAYDRIGNFVDISCKVRLSESVEGGRDQVVFVSASSSLLLDVEFFGEVDVYAKSIQVWRSKLGLARLSAAAAWVFDGKGRDNAAEISPEPNAGDKSDEGKSQ